MSGTKTHKIAPVRVAVMEYNYQSGNLRDDAIEALSTLLADDLFELDSSGRAICRSGETIASLMDRLHEVHPWAYARVPGSEDGPTPPSRAEWASLSFNERFLAADRFEAAKKSRGK